MFAQSTGTAALVLSLLAPSIASAQSTQPLDRPTVVVFANGGGNSSLTDLNDAGTASLKTGWTAGGGAGVQLNRYVAIRGTFDFAKADGQNATFSGQSLNHYFYGGDVQLRYPTTGGLAPYVLLGAGAVTIDNPDDAAFDRFTKFAGKGGVGVEYAVPRSNFGLFAQANSYLYKFDRNGFDKTQVDLLWTGGLSYRLPR
jgi:Outer membrane protein beta-barrel domain